VNLFHTVRLGALGVSSGESRCGGSEQHEMLGPHLHDLAVDTTMDVDVGAPTTITKKKQSNNGLKFLFLV
jgi:hypothetical protein